MFSLAVIKELFGKQSINRVSLCVLRSVTPALRHSLEHGGACVSLVYDEQIEVRCIITVGMALESPQTCRCTMNLFVSNPRLFSSVEDKHPCVFVLDWIG